MERNGRERAELAEHIKSHQGRKHVCVCPSHAPATRRDGAGCAVSTEIRRGKTRTRRQARQRRTSGRIGRQKPRRGKETRSRWKQDPEQTSRIHSCFPSREVAEDCPFPLQLVNSTFILLKEKAKGRQTPVFLRGALREIQTLSSLSV